MSSTQLLHRSLRFLRNILTADTKRLICVCIAVTAMQTVLLLAQPVVVSRIIRDALSGSAGISWQLIVLAGAMLAAATFGYLVSVVNNRILQSVRVSSKSVLYSHFLALPPSIHRGRNEGWFESSIGVASFASRSLVYDFVNALVRMATFIVMAAALIVITEPVLGSMFVVAALVYARLSFHFAHNSARYVSGSVAASTDLSQEMGDTLANIDSVQMAHKADFESSRIEPWLAREKAAYIKAQGTIDRGTFIQKIFLVGLFTWFVASTALFAAGDVDRAVMFYIVGLMAYSQLDDMGVTLNSLFEGSEQLCTVLDESQFDRNSNVVTSQDVLSPPQGSSIEISNLSFARDGNIIIDDLSLSIDQGQHVLISGKSGAGKTTLLRLIAGEYSPDRGSVAIGGDEVTTLPAHRRAKAIHIVMQHSKLFDRSLYENVSYCDPSVTREEVEELLLDLGLEDMKKRAGETWLDDNVGKAGLNLSGGEVQRVLIARALVAKPPILVLDEATSAMDEGSETRVLERMHLVLKDSTIIAVSHHPHPNMSGYTVFSL